MKTITQIFILLLIAFSSFSQSTFDKALADVSTDISAKLNQKNIKKIVVLYITDIDKATTNAGKYMADIISINIVNNAGNFEVFDRDNLQGIVEAKKLMSEGYIDVDKAKELGKILSVEAIIIGNYTKLSNSIKLTLKALDSSTGFIIAATMNDIPLSDDAGAILGINISSNNSNNRGFNAPVQSDENYNNPEKVDKDCMTKGTGDFCFTNSTTKKLFVEIQGTRHSQEISLEPGQTQCFYNLIAINYSYKVDEGYLSPQQQFDVGYGRYKAFSRKGQIMVEKCKSKTLIIK